MKKTLASILESFSLTLFLIYIHVMEMKITQDWLAPYFLSSVIGVLTSAYLIKRGIILNRIFLGITLYFLSGLLGLTVEWTWLNQLYGQLGAVAMLCWIIFIGVLSSCFSPYGFLGLTQTHIFSIKTGSLLLLLACITATALAWRFTGSKLLGEWIPFIFLFSMRSILLQLGKKDLAQA